MTKDKKTEHAGAKNGGGHWGTREEAKTFSKKARRINNKKNIRQELAGLKDHTKKSFKTRGGS